MIGVRPSYRMWLHFESLVLAVAQTKAVPNWNPGKWNHGPTPKTPPPKMKAPLASKFEAQASPIWTPRDGRSWEAMAGKPWTTYFKLCWALLAVYIALLSRLS